MTVLSLDTGPLSLITQRKGHPDADACKQWLAALLASAVRVVVPSVVDYELRRELLRAGKSTSLARLDAFLVADPGRVVPLTDHALRRAAQMWAQARRSGLPTADVRELDIDVVQVAQLLEAGINSADLVVATSNVGHLSRYVRAELWQNIHP